MLYLLIGLVVFTVGGVLSKRLIPLLLRHQVIDYPNRRSLHTTPIPRGGGLSIVVIFLAVLLFFITDDAINQFNFTVLFLAGLSIAVLGFFDDIGGVPVALRLLFHIIIVAGSIFLLGTPSVAVGEYVFEAGWAGLYMLEFIVLLWVVNFFNFMDGIDMIASIEAISIALGASLILAVTTPGHGMIMPLICLAAATAGFMIWNYPPARVFMGDVASSFLGLVFGLMAIITSIDQSMNIWVWFILFGVFFTDATVTVLRRLAGRRKIYIAHCDHAYQRAAMMWQTKFGREYLQSRATAHRNVSTAIAAINIIWLLPLALAAALYPRWGAVLTCIALLPLVVAAFALGAGSGRDSESEKIV